jgi:hypothetical protein
LALTVQLTERGIGKEKLEREKERKAGKEKKLK